MMGITFTDKYCCEICNDVEILGEKERLAGGYVAILCHHCLNDYSEYFLENEVKELGMELMDTSWFLAPEGLIQMKKSLFLKSKNWVKEQELKVREEKLKAKELGQ